MNSPAVVFEHVTFAFDDHPVLKDVSFVIPAGQMRIMLGASGAGKSVILKLILGLFRPDSGRIFVHGSRIDNMREQDLLKLRGDVGMLFPTGPVVRLLPGPHDAAGAVPPRLFAHRSVLRAGLALDG